jgi:hypothetical protein
MHLYFCDTD